MSSIESFGSLDDYGLILETFPILQFESTKKAFSNFVKIEKEAKDSIKEAKLEFEKHKKYLRLQLENYKKVKNVIQQFQDMKQLIENELSDFDQNDIREECSDFLQEMPADWGKTPNEKISTFCTLIGQLANLSYSKDIQINVGNFQIKKPKPILQPIKCTSDQSQYNTNFSQSEPPHLVARKPISRGRGKSLIPDKIERELGINLKKDSGFSEETTFNGVEIFQANPVYNGKMTEDLRQLLNLKNITISDTESKPKQNVPIPKLSLLPNRRKITDHLRHTSNNLSSTESLNEPSQQKNNTPVAQIEADLLTESDHSETGDLEYNIISQYSYPPKVFVPSQSINGIRPVQNVSIEYDTQYTYPPKEFVPRLNTNKTKPVVKSTEIQEPSPIPDQMKIRQKSVGINLSDIYKTKKKFDCELIIKIDDKFKNPMGLGVSKDYMIIANSCEQSVIAYDLEGNFKSYLKGSGPFTMPTAVGVSAGGVIYVKDDSQVHVFDHKLNFLNCFGKAFFTKMPVGLMFINELIYVIDNDEFILEFSLNGCFKTKTKINWIKKTCKKPRIRYGRSFEETLYLSDMANFQVLFCNTQGQIIRTVGTGIGNGIDQFKQPAGLCSDILGGFIIADSKNHRIQVYDKSGKCLGSLNLGFKVTRPADVILSNNGTIFITALDGNAYIFKLK